MTNDVFSVSKDAKERMARARELIERGKLEMEKAKRAGLTDVVSKMEAPLKEADQKLRQLEAVYR